MTKQHSVYLDLNPEHLGSGISNTWNAHTKNRNQQLSFTLIGISLFVAVINWFAVAKNWQRIIFASKPAVVLLLILWLVLNGGLENQALYFVVGLSFSIAGDIFLMLPNDKFIPGLISFLLAHIAYILGFNSILPNLTFAGLILTGLVGINAFAIFRRLSSGLESRGQDSLRIPILIYSIVIGLMLISALLTLVSPNNVWGPLPALLVSFGAILFFLSDTLLAWNRFINPISAASLMIIVTYHLAQIAITLGAGLNFLT